MWTIVVFVGECRQLRTSLGQLNTVGTGRAEYGASVQLWWIECVLCVCDVQFDQMMKIVEVLGVPPRHMLDNAPKANRFFDRLPDGSYIPKKSKEGKVV